MSIIYMAKKDTLPIGFYSARELAESISSDVVEIDIPVLEGVSTGCIFYVDAIYSLFSFNNGVPQETTLTIGPAISRSANIALNNLFSEIARRRLSGCELDHFLCFELDRFYGEPLVEEPIIYNDPATPHFTCPGDCKNDPLIQKTWNMLLEGKTWDIDHLTLNQLIQELSMRNPEIDLHNRYYSFTANLVIRSLVKMCTNNASVSVLINSEKPNILDRVRFSKVGYLVFMDVTAVNDACTDNTFQPSLEKDMFQSWKLSDVFEYFIDNEEYGVYFVQSLANNRYLFVDKMLIKAIYRDFIMLQRAEIKDDYFELSLSDSARALLDSPQWYGAWKPQFIIAGTKLVSYIGENTRVIIPEEVTIIGKEAFYGSMIRSIRIPKSVLVIEEYAFASCKNLVSVSIPSSVQAIECGAFQDCINLKTVKFKGEVVDLDYSTFSNCKNLTTLSVGGSIGVCFSSLLQDASLNRLSRLDRMDRSRINEDFETRLSLDDFSGTPIKRKIYDPKCRDMSDVDVSDESIDLTGDIIETAEVVDKNAIRIKTANHLLEIKVSREGLYFNSAGYLLPREDINTFVGCRLFKCYVTDGYDLHSYYYSEIEYNRMRERSELFPELYKVVFEADSKTFEILLYNAYDDWFGNESIHVEIVFDGLVVSVLNI